MHYRSHGFMQPHFNTYRNNQHQSQHLQVRRYLQGSGLWSYKQFDLFWLILSIFVSLFIIITLQKK